MFVTPLRFAVNRISPAVNVIKETFTFETLLKHKKPGTLFITDIDNVVAKTQKQLGSDQWFRWRIVKAKQNSEPFENALNDWTALQFKIDLYPVEEKTVSTIKQIQKEKFPLIAITSRGMRLGDRTVKQIERFGTSFNQPQIYEGEIFWPRNQFGSLTEHILFEQGILFTAGQNKGDALIKFLEKTNEYPDDIVYIDDLKSHVVDVAKACNKLSINFFGYHYRYLEKWVERFQPKIADQHLQKFQQMFTDF